MHIGIDLGTTYSCVAFIGEGGVPVIIPSSDAIESTPSVIWFDGKAAFVGKKANDRKITPTSPVYEFVKRDIGKSRELNLRYEINGFYYGAVGMSAIILRKLKKEAYNYFKKNAILTSNTEEKQTTIPAVITVPAYFGDLQRHETRMAGYAAGFDVLAIINEPTAAALAYGRTLRENKKIMVFDLGGGTFDVTLLEVRNGKSVVIASDGADQLGGKDWDMLITDYIYTEYKKRTGKEIPDDMGWEIQQQALRAKYELTDNNETATTISSNGNDVEIPMFRSAPAIDVDDEFDMDKERPFYFEERSSNLLVLCSAICSRVMERTGLSWGDVDDIVLAGGSCRMPMIPAMLEHLSGRKIQRNIPGFSYDTAIAIGAAIYGSGMNSVQDVTSKSIGIEVEMNGRPFIEQLIPKNKLLPAQVEKKFKAVQNATLKVFEGESTAPEECLLRGKLELENPEGSVNVKMRIDENGVLSSIIEFSPDGRKELRIKTDDGDIDVHELKEKISAIDIRI